MKPRVILAGLAVCALVVIFFTFRGTSGALFTVLAFVVGVCVGVAWDDAYDLFRASRKDQAVAHESETPQQTINRHRFNTTTALGWSLIVAAIALLAVGVLLIVTNNTTESYSRCTAEWQQQFGEAYKARVDAATAVSNAMDDIVLSVAEEDQAKFDAAVQHYVEVRETQQKEQLDNPLPPLPEALCGER